MNQPNEISNTSPLTLNHVVGQQRACQQLQIALDAYFNERMTNGASAFPHLLLVGPPGIGKSMLSNLIAGELAVTLHEELAQNLPKPSMVQGFLMMIEQGGVAFLDEIHELPPQCQTTLYRCLEERRLFLGGNRKAVSLPSFTFVAATTDEWLLAKPLRDRFKLVLRLQHYSEEELAKLLTQRVKALGWSVDDEAIVGIAKRGRNTPRLALRLLEAARRHQLAQRIDTINLDHLEGTCKIEGIDELGLDIVEQRYMELLRQAQGALRLNIISTQLSLPRRTIERVVEPDMIRLGLITKTEDGRLLTAAGLAHLNAQQAEQKVSDSRKDGGQ